MKTLLRAGAAAATGLLLVGGAAAQTNAPPLPETTLEATNTWAFSAAAFAYFIPHERDFVNPIFKADRDWLHLEARYNYEGLDTGSVWLGYNFSVGEKLVFTVTPMVGGVFGHVTGPAPGYECSLSYGNFTLASEGEYVFDVRDRAGNFFYTWSELSYAPFAWCRLGLVAQTNQPYQSDYDVQWGPLVGFNYRAWEFTTYLLNAGTDSPTVVVALTFSF